MRKCSKPDGNKNWVGKRIAELRKDRGMSQNDLAIKLQNYGVDIDKNAVQLLEHGHQYFVILSGVSQLLETCFLISSSKNGSHSFLS